MQDKKCEYGLLYNGQISLLLRLDPNTPTKIWVSPPIIERTSPGGNPQNPSLYQVLLGIAVSAARNGRSTGVPVDSSEQPSVVAAKDGQPIGVPVDSRKQPSGVAKIISKIPTLLPSPMKTRAQRRGKEKVSPFVWL